MFRFFLFFFLLGFICTDFHEFPLRISRDLTYRIITHMNYYQFFSSHRSSIFFSYAFFDTTNHIHYLSSHSKIDYCCFFSCSTSTVEYYYFSFKRGNANSKPFCLNSSNHRQRINDLLIFIYCTF